MPPTESSDMFASPRDWPVALAAAPGLAEDHRLAEDHGLFRRPAALYPGIAAAPLGAGAVDRFVVQVMSIDLLTTVILQRIYLGVSVTLGTHFVALAILLFCRRTRISGVRVVLYWLFWGSALALQFISGNTFSPGSILLGLACYAGFLFVVPASEQTYFEVVKVYQRVAAAVSILVFLDLALQIAGFGMPDMNAVVPSSITAPTMNYIQPLAWRAGISKPNAFFMLEASFTAQFIAIALLIELALFRRWIWISGFALALLGTFSGTGLMLVVLTLPILARRFWRMLLIYGVIMLPLLGGVAVATGWYEIAARRVTSFDNKDSSAYQRFVGPFTMVYDVLAEGDAHNIFYGFGAGKTANTENIPGIEFLEYNPISKIFIEYGLVILVFFMFFVSYCTFWAGVPFIIAYTAFMEYHFMGGYLSIPPILNYWYILAAGWAISRGARVANEETGRHI